VTAPPGSSIAPADATAALQPVTLRDKLARFTDHWAPRVVA
jgi:hypothetical protein